MERRVRTFKSKRENVSDGCIKPHNKQFQDLESIINTISEIKWRRMKQDRQRAYNITLRPVSAAIVTQEKQEVLHKLSLYL